MATSKSDSGHETMVGQMAPPVTRFTSVLLLG